MWDISYIIFRDPSSLRSVGMTSPGQHLYHYLNLFANISLFFIFANHLLIFVNKRHARAQKRRKLLQSLNPSKYRHRQTPSRRWIKETMNPRRWVYMQCIAALLIYKTDERCVPSIPSLLWNWRFRIPGQSKKRFILYVTAAVFAVGLKSNTFFNTTLIKTCFSCVNLQWFSHFAHLSKEW